MDVVRALRWTARTWRAPKGDGKRSRESAWAFGAGVGAVSRYRQGDSWYPSARLGERYSDFVDGPPMRRRVDAKRWVESQLAKGTP